MISLEDEYFVALEEWIAVFVQVIILENVPRHELGR
jgi:hypothetical protein